MNITPTTEVEAPYTVTVQHKENTMKTLLPYTGIQLRPMSYSKARTIEAVRANLIAAPKQADNSPAVFEGRVMEFALPNGRPAAGTLEWYGANLNGRFSLMLDDGVLVVKMDSLGNWIEERELR